MCMTYKVNIWVPQFVVLLLVYAISHIIDHSVLIFKKIYFDNQEIDQTTYHIFSNNYVKKRILFIKSQITQSWHNITIDYIINISTLKSPENMIRWENEQLIFAEKTQTKVIKKHAYLNIEIVNRERYRQPL